MIKLELFPGAVIKAPSWKVHGGKGGTGKRGKISGLTPHSAGRLREFLLTRHVPGRVPWAVTLTIRRAATPAEWRILWHRFRDRARRCLTAAVYRVELQRRRVPHIHAVAWIVAHPRRDDPGREEQLDLHYEQMELWRGGWLDCITPPGPDGNRVYDLAEYYHATHMRPVDNEGWAVYQAIHHGKSKRAQLGWIGKQWGVIGRAFFRRRKAVQLELSLGQYWVFRRLMRRLLRARGAKRTALPAHGRWVRAIDSTSVEKVVAWVRRSVSLDAKLTGSPGG